MKALTNTSLLRLLPCLLICLFGYSIALAQCYIPNTKTITHIDCNNATGSIQWTPLGGTPPYTITWAGPGGYTATGDLITGLQPGNYTFTVMDGQPCTVSISPDYYEVLDKTIPPTITESIQHVDCSHSLGSIDITVSNANTPLTYLWNTSATTEDLIDLPTGNYSVTISDAGGCTFSESYLITDNSATLSASFSTTNATCNAADGSIDMTVSGGTTPYSYAWSNSATTEDQTLIASGPYFVTITDANGCSLETDVLVDEANSIVTSVNVVPDVCEQSIGEAYLTPTGGTPPYNYYWFIGGYTTSSRTGLITGIYPVIVTDANGCKDYVIFSVGYESGYTVTESITHIDCNNSTGSIDLTVTGAAPPVNYLWSTTATTQDVSSLAPGMYGVTIWDNNGCGEILQFEVEDHSFASATATPTNATCNSTDGSIDLTVVGGAPPLTYSWSNSATTEDLSGVASGPYFVTITDANGCTMESDALVDETNSITTGVTVTPDVCGQGIGTATLTPAGGTGPYTYYWFLDGNINQNRTDLGSGWHGVIVTDANGCIDYVTFIVGYESGYIVTENITHVDCNNSTGSIDLTVTGAAPPVNYLWSTTATTQDLSGLTPGLYGVTIWDNNGCGEILEFEVEDNNVVANFSPSATTVTVNDYVYFTNTSSNATSYEWFVNGSSVATSTDLNYQFTSTGVFTIRLEATDGTCDDDYQIQITVNSMLPRGMFVNHYLMEHPDVELQPTLQGNLVFVSADNNSKAVKSSQSPIANANSWRQNTTAEQLQKQSLLTDDAEQISFKLYPNPNHGNMTLDYELVDSSADFVMYDMYGRQIISQTLKAETNKAYVDATNLTSGIYFYKLISHGQQVQTGRVVIAH